jgi:cbb3-type cytochrome oxidase maturation protein
MESLWVLIPLSVMLAFIIGALFWWAAGTGQFEDLEGPGERLLQDDDRAPDLQSVKKIQ